MSESVFSGLSLVRHDGRIQISYPNRIHEFGRVASAAREHGVSAQAAGDGWLLNCSAAEAAYPAPLKTLFADLNDLPPPYPPFEPGRLRKGEPLVSCIIVVNENMPFVREQLLPSLQANSAKHAIELIVVCNGSTLPPAPDLGNVRVLQSEWGVVSKAYNAGARASRGRYLAIFHDDCIVCDPLWIEKCLQRLERGAHAVAGEYREINSIGGVTALKLPVAKCVPLVVSRADYEEVGGYDEYHYIGYEDLDFTLALASHDKKLVATDLRVQHFHGMSSTLKYNPVPGLHDLYAFTALPRFAIMQRFKEFWSGGMRVDGVDVLQVATDAQLLYVLAKYGDFLARSGNSAYAQARAALEREIAAACPWSPDAALERFREIDRRAGTAVAKTSA